MSRKATRLGSACCLGLSWAKHRWKKMNDRGFLLGCLILYKHLRSGSLWQERWFQGCLVPAKQLSGPWDWLRLGPYLGIFRPVPFGSLFPGAATNIWCFEGQVEVKANRTFSREPWMELGEIFGFGPTQTPQPHGATLGFQTAFFSVTNSSGLSNYLASKGAKVTGVSYRRWGAKAVCLER